MSTTQLFVELLVIGLGAGIWISLLADVLFAGPARMSQLWSDKSIAVLLLAAAYAIGIVLDRLAWSLFLPLERRLEKKYLAPLGVRRAHVERLVSTAGEVLAKDLYYNRSRLRICRAWVLNGALITLVSPIWNEIKNGSNHALSFGLGIAGMVFVACSLWAVKQFMNDYYTNLMSSFEFLTDRTRQDKNAG